MAEGYVISGPTFVASDSAERKRAGMTISYSDGSDAYANGGKVISFYHLPSERSVYFKAFITAFNETFTSDWAQESVYGRSDPIYMFKQTKRNVSLAFKIPAASDKEAFENLARVQGLAQFLYPTYENPNGLAEAQTITNSPMVRLKVMNLLRKNDPTAMSALDVGSYPQNCGGLDSANGLLGVIESVAIDHSLAAVDGVVELGNSVILSKIIEVNLNFSVIHEQPLGWQNKNEFMTPSFPYGASTATTGPVDSGAGAGATGEDNNSATNDSSAADAAELTGRDRRKMRRESRRAARDYRAGELEGTAVPAGLGVDAGIDAPDSITRRTA